MPGVAEIVGPEKTSPTTIGVPVRAETGMTPQAVEPEIVTSVAATQALPSQYSMLESEFNWPSVSMQIFAVPVLVPLTFTS